MNDRQIRRVYYNNEKAYKRRLFTLNILIVLLYILGSLLLLLIALLLFILLIPIRYSFNGGYKNHPWLSFSLRCSPAFIISGAWNEQENKLLKTRFTLLGIPINFDPQKFKKKEKKDKPKRDRKKKKLSSVLIVLDRDLQARGFALIQDLLYILMPDQLSLKGKIGFDEPHLTGWLAAVTSILDYCCKETLIELEPVWDEEYYELEGIFNGRIRVGVIVVKVGWFLLKLRARQLFANYRKNNLAASA